MLNQAQLLICHSHDVNESATAHVLPPPCQFELECSSPASTSSIWAQPIICHTHHVNSSTTAYVTPPPCPLKPDHLCFTPTMSIQARTLIFCICYINSSSTTYLPSSVSIQAGMLIFCLYHVNSSLIAHLPPPTAWIWVQLLVSHFHYTPTASIWVQLLMSHLHYTLSILITHVPPPPCQFELEHLSLLCESTDLCLGITYSEQGTHKRTLCPQRSLKDRTKDEGTLDTTRWVLDCKTDAVIVQNKNEERIHTMWVLSTIDYLSRTCDYMREVARGEIVLWEDIVLEQKEQRRR